MIQIGATDDQGKAQELLNRARAQTRALASAQPFTEKVQRGSETLGGLASPVWTKVRPKTRAAR